MQAFHVISLTLLAVLAANAQVIRPGKCPHAAVQQNFDVAKYLGRWYEIQKLPAIFQKGQCGQATYALRSPGVVSVLNEELLNDGTVSTAIGKAVVVDAAEPAKLEVSFFENQPPGPYWVLSTDYENYTLIYGCTSLGENLRYEFSWILARQPSLPEETLVELRSILTSNGVEVEKLMITDQDAERCSAMPQ
ncbi:apolipoprotein D-like [Aplochiton taeniatus]